MPSLHVVNRLGALDLAINGIRSGDTLLLIEDGVYGVGMLERTDLRVCVIASDVQARGVVGIADEVTQIDHTEFVELCVSHTPVISW